MPDALDRPFLLGLDPGVVTGLAAVAADDPTAVLLVASAAPLDVLHRLGVWAADARLVAAVLEDSRPLPLYHRNRGAGRGERDRIARSVGTVDCLTGLYADALAALGVPVVCVPPVRAAKWDAETCARLTGWTARTNEHGRDALRHVWGRAGAASGSAPHARTARHARDGRAVQDRPAAQ